MRIRLVLLLALFSPLLVQPLRAQEEERPAVTAAPFPETDPVAQIQEPLHAGAETTEGRREPQALDAVEIRGWTFSRLIFEGHLVYHQPTVRTDLLSRVLMAISRAHTEVPRLLGVPVPSVEYFVFAEQADLERAVGQLTEVPARYVVSAADGVAFEEDGQPIVFTHAALFQQEADGDWVLAHELAHHLLTRLAPDDRYPTWFNEGIAEYVGAEVSRLAYPEHFALTRFSSMGKLVNAARKGAILSFGPLETDAQWAATSRADRWGLLYSQAWLSVEWLMQRRHVSSLSRAVSLVGSGQTFSSAFPEVFDLPLADLDAAFQRHLMEAYGSRYPLGITSDSESAPTDGRIYFVLSLQPGEEASLDYQSSQCRGSQKVSTDGLGFAVVWLGESATRCAGAYTLTLLGSLGTRSTLRFTLTAPRTAGRAVLRPPRTGFAEARAMTISVAGTPFFIGKGSVCSIRHPDRPGEGPCPADDERVTSSLPVR